MKSDHLGETSFASTLAATGLSDKDLSALFRVNQSTVSRLRTGKTRRIGKYAALLEARGLAPADRTDQIDAAMISLAALARTTPALATLLCNLHKLLQGVRPDR